jgi:hypothetical protein
MFNKKLSINFIIFSILLIFQVLFFFILPNFESENTFSNNIYLFKKNKSKQISDFKKISFNAYLNSMAFENPENLEKYYNLIKSNNYSNNSILEMVFAYSTDSLLKYQFDSLVYNPDVIKNLIFWVEEFNYYKRNDTSSFSIIYPSIYDFWMNKIGNCVIQASEKDSNLKYDKRFNFIINQLESKKYSIGIKFSNFEKLIDNIVKGKWYYIYNRVMIETSFLVKFCIFVFFIITICSYIFFLKFIILKIKNKIK